MVIYAELLQRFRARLNLKQDALAELLGVSQSTISRIESGALSPKAELRSKLDRFFADPANQSLFSRCHAVVRASPVVSFLFGVRGGDVVLHAASEPALALGGLWAEQEVGAPLGGALGLKGREYLRRLVEMGAFRGELASIEMLRRHPADENDQVWRLVLVPVRDDLGDWCIHATAVPVSPRKAARLKAQWNGGLRIAYHEETAPAG